MSDPYDSTDFLEDMKKDIDEEDKENREEEDMDVTKEEVIEWKAEYASMKPGKAKTALYQRINSWSHKLGIPLDGQKKAVPVVKEKPAPEKPKRKYKRRESKADVVLTLEGGSGRDFRIEIPIRVVIGEIKAVPT